MESLQFNVAQLLKQPTGATRHYEIEESIAALTDEVEFTSPLQGSIRFTRTADGVLVTGHLATTAVVECRRCAASFVAPVNVDLEEEFRTAYDVYTGLRLPAQEDDEEATMIDEHHMLDLSEVLRQDLLLALPLFPLCREDCAGLCPYCGKDLNEGPCDCAGEELGTRWSALRELIDRASP